MKLRGAVLILGLGVACGPVASSSGPAAPVNACPDNPCSAFGATIVCDGGSCLVTPPLASPSWTAVITTSQDATYYAPGVTVVLPLQQLLGTAPAAALPVLATLTGDVQVSPSAALDANWYLGNPGNNTTLPVQAKLWPLWSSGSSPVDAVSLGLPLAPIVLANREDGLLPPGPGGGPSYGFFGALLPPLVYQAVLQPMPPFDEAYPPDVNQVDLTTVQSLFDKVIIDSPDFDKTIQQGNGNSRPVFDFSRADGGSLDGWTAWLRDQTTLRRISNLAHLHGSAEGNVQLLTRHHVGDALTNAQLVMAPPAQELLPTWIFTPAGSELAEKEAYPRLPSPITASGTVGVPAEIVFEATGVCRYATGGAVPVLDKNPSYVFSRQVTTSDGRYRVELPLGEYRVTIIPSDSTAALTTVPGFLLSDPKSCKPVGQIPVLTTQKQRKVSGLATIADKRPLAGATAEAVPTRCSDGSIDSVCLPRPARAIVAADGSYTLSLDPGAYLLRVRPAEGTRFPWVVQGMSVDPSTKQAPPTVVPAPINAGLTLVDPAGNPVIQAVVRVFQTPMVGAPYEIGAAITDGAGHFDMYLAPTAQ